MYTILQRITGEENTEKQKSREYERKPNCMKEGMGCRDNKGVTTCATVEPTREYAKMDLHQTMYDDLGTKFVDIKWIAGHRQDCEARNGGTLVRRARAGHLL